MTDMRNRDELDKLLDDLIQAAKDEAREIVFTGDPLNEAREAIRKYVFAEAESADRLARWEHEKAQNAKKLVDDEFRRREENNCLAWENVDPVQTGKVRKFLERIKLLRNK